MGNSLMGRFVMIAVAMGVSGTTAAANLLWNGDFRTDLSAWTVDTPEASSAAFIPSGSGGPGSIRITNFDPGPGQGHGVFQCVGPVTPGATYTYSAQVRFPTGQQRTGSAEIGLIWYPGPGCTGADFGGPRAGRNTPNDSFVLVNGGAKVAPPGATSVRVIGYPSKVEGGGQLVADFDDFVFDDGLLDPAPNHQGLWWVAPAGFEAGWGINFAHQGDIIFATWFTYGLDGKPLWLAAQLQRTSDGVYSGDLFTTTGPPFNAVPFDPALVVETTVGTATLTFSGDNHATFSYTVNTGGAAKAAITQTKEITRQIYTTPAPHCVFNKSSDLTLATNYQDLWWRFPGSSESGWGINFTHQGDIIFATWFTYDANGKPWWLAAVLLPGSPGVYSGDLFTTVGPPFNAVPFDPAKVVETVVGHAELTFDDGNNASFDYTVNGTSQTKRITRQVFAGLGTVCN